MSTYPYTCGDLTNYGWGWGFRPSAVEVERVTVARAKPGTPRAGRQDADGYGCAGSVLAEALDYGNAPRESDELWSVIDADPAVTLTKAVIIVPILEADRAYEAREGTPDEWVDAVRESFEPHMDEVLREAASAVISHGRKSFEVVYGEREGSTAVADVRPLDYRRAVPQVVKGTGEFGGLEVTTREGDKVVLPPPYALHFTSDACNRSPFGVSWYRPVRQVWWEKLNDLRELAKIGQKASGRQAKIYYPPGEGNDDVATTILAAYMRGEGAKFPNATGALTSDLAADYRNIQGLAETALWRIEVEDFGNTGPATSACLEKLKARNADISRAMKAPERASQTGDKGTNAESDTQSQVNLAVSQLLFDSLVGQVQPAVDALLVARFGESARGAVTIKAGKIRDQYAEGDNKVLDALLINPDTFEVLAEEIDVDAVLDRRNVPKLKGVLDFAKALKAKREEKAQADATLAELSQPQQPDPGGDPNADPFGGGLGLTRSDRLARSMEGLSRLLDPDDDTAGGFVPMLELARDGDGDGFVAGPDGRDNVPADAKHEAGDPKHEAVAVHAAELYHKHLADVREGAKSIQQKAPAAFKQERAAIKSSPEAKDLKSLSDTVYNAAEKVTGRAPSPAEARKVVDGALANMPAERRQAMFDTFGRETVESETGSRDDVKASIDRAAAKRAVDKVIGELPDSQSQWFDNGDFHAAAAEDLAYNGRVSRDTLATHVHAARPDARDLAVLHAAKAAHGGDATAGHAYAREHAASLHAAVRSRVSGND